jgi:surface protein
MFYQASNFNQPLNSWDVSQVTDMSQMFYLASVFNQSLNSWNTTNLKTTYIMFAFATNFNGNISNWDTHNVTTMAYMFDVASNFNGDISLWNTSKVTSMANMFALDIAFNQSIGNWDTSQVTSMTYMFYNSTFDQNISKWNVTKVTDMSFMFNGAKLSTINYNALLFGWSSEIVKNNVPFDAGNSIYSNCSGIDGITSHNILTGTYNWTIIDGGSIACNTCTYSGSGVWIIQVSDNCTINTQTINNTINVNGTGGYLFVNGTVLAKSISMTPSIFNGNFMVRILIGKTFGVFK